MPLMPSCDGSVWKGRELSAPLPVRRLFTEVTGRRSASFCPHGSLQHSPPVNQVHAPVRTLGRLLRETTVHTVGPCGAQRGADGSGRRAERAERRGRGEAACFWSGPALQFQRRFGGGAGCSTGWRAPCFLGLGCPEFPGPSSGAPPVVPPGPRRWLLSFRCQCR